MRQKYLIEKNNDANELNIKEFAELYPGIFSMTCEENYAVEVVASAIEKGKSNLISLLRTENLFPPSVFAEEIANAVIAVFSTDSSESTELMLNAADLIQKRESVEEVGVEEEVKEVKEVEEVEEVEEEEEAGALEIDELLDVGPSDKGSVDVSSVKVADDDGSFEGEG